MILDYRRRLKKAEIDYNEIEARTYFSQPKQGPWYKFAVEWQAVPLARKLTGLDRSEAWVPVTFTKGYYLSYRPFFKDHLFRIKVDGEEFSVGLRFANESELPKPMYCRFF